MSTSLLASIPKRSKDCHERFRLDTGEWTDLSDESYTESEAPNSNPPKKKLSLPKEGIDGDLWTKQRKQLFRKVCTQKYRYKHKMGCVELCCVARWPKRSLLH